jgi:ribonuclease P protein subunit POP4
MKPEEIVRDELIGLEVRVVESANRSQAGLEGRVVDESRQTLSIETEVGVKVLPKDQCTFSFLLPSGERVQVEGKLLVARPEDRIKKRFRSW